MIINKEEYNQGSVVEFLLWLGRTATYVLHQVSLSLWLWMQSSDHWQYNSKAQRLKDFSLSTKKNLLDTKTSLSKAWRQVYIDGGRGGDTMNQNIYYGLALSSKAIMDRDKMNLDIHKINIILKKLHEMKETTLKCTFIKKLSQTWLARVILWDRAPTGTPPLVDFPHWRR